MVKLQNILSLSLQKWGFGLNANLKKTKKLIYSRQLKNEFSYFPETLAFLFFIFLKYAYKFRYVLYLLDKERSAFWPM